MKLGKTVNQELIFERNASRTLFEYLSNLSNLHNRANALRATSTITEGTVNYSAYEEHILPWLTLGKIFTAIK